MDGDENTSPYHRINQNGPASMGSRGQPQYLNLNRDDVKADAPEMCAWLKLWQRWLPDFLIDVHTMLRLGAAQLQQLPAPRHPAAATLTFDTVPPMTFDLA